MVAVAQPASTGPLRRSGLHAVFDTTILIDQLNGIPAAREEILRYAYRSISAITWIEVMTGVRSPDDEQRARRLLEQFAFHAPELEIAERSAFLRREHRLRTPDAIIWATAQHLNAILVTRNTKDFPADDPGVRFPYVI